jgi:NADPH:quinone reductase-like Zn-dependent oxidoreductase
LIYKVTGIDYMNEDMKAVVITGFDGPEVLEIDDVPKPQPRPGRMKRRC